MHSIRIFRLWALFLCILALAVPAGAAEVDSGSVYCFATGDFSENEPIQGICITSLPESASGTVFLGARVVQPGDILTADQAAQMTFASASTQEDKLAQIGYLSIYENRVAPCSTMTISIRGKENKSPIAEDTAIETYKNLPSTAQLKASDPEGETLIFTVTRQPKRGSVTVAEDGSFTYTPKKNKVGVDSFTYTAADPAGNVSREATVTVTILKPSDSTQYTDTTGRSCQFTAEWMKQTGIFTGETIGQQICFQPDKTVSRGEFVTMLVNTLDIPTDDQLACSGYTDQIPTWLQPYLTAAIRSGLTAGLPNQEVFGVNKIITGAEVAVMLQNALDLSPADDSAAAFREEDPHWASVALCAARDNGFPLEADMPLTRETAAQILYHCTRF